MNTRHIESDPRFLPRRKTGRGGLWQRLAVLAVLAGYVGLAAAQDEPIQVWLVVLSPLALIVLALVLRLTDNAGPA